MTKIFPSIQTFWQTYTIPILSVIVLFLFIGVIALVKGTLASGSSDVSPTPTISQYPQPTLETFTPVSITPDPTPTKKIISTPKPTATRGPTPTITPTITPTPTTTPNSTPTPSPSPSSTPSPTPVPTTEPTITPTPTP